MFLLAFLFSIAFAGNILVFNPNLGHSHVRFMGNLADFYAKDGHNVTILTLVMDENNEFYGTSNPDVHKIAFKSPYLNQSHWDKMKIKNPSFWETPEFDGGAWGEWDLFMEGFRLSYRGLLEDKSLLNSLTDSKFDLGLTEIYEFGSIGIFEILGIKTTMLGAALGQISFHYDISGLPYFPSFIPGWITTYGAEMTFFERLQNVWAEIDVRLLDWRARKKLEVIFREHYPNLPGFVELADKRVGVILSNVNEFTESPRPSTNMYQYVGGTNVHPPKALGKEIDDLLNIRPSAVLFSFGSFIKSCQMPSKLKIEILEAMSQFPEVTFLWKYEKCENDSTPFFQYPNVIPKPWWPQTDLLGDSRVKAFVTHAGMNSMLEVAIRGKPSITVPLFADQYVNAKTAVAIGMSTMIKRTQLGKKTLVAALEKALDKEGEMAKKARMAANVLDGRGEEYRKETLRWARLLIKYGPMAHHRLPSKHLNLIQLYSLDCLFFVFLTTILVVFVLWKAFKLFPSVRLVEKLKKL